jgi:hypothetical protein
MIHKTVVADLPPPAPELYGAATKGNAVPNCKKFAKTSIYRSFPALVTGPHVACVSRGVADKVWESLKMLGFLSQQNLTPATS